MADEIILTPEDTEKYAGLAEAPIVESAPEGTEEGQEPSEPEIDYRIKFSESSKEAQRLYEEKKNLTSRMTDYESQLAEKQAEIDNIYKTLETDNPDVKETLELKKSISEIQKELLIRKENEAIGEFIKGEPDADSHRKAIQDFGRTYPGKSYNEIWNEFFKPLIEKGKSVKDLRANASKTASIETGRGSASPELSSTIDENFNKLPLEKRKEILRKMGI